MRVPGRAVGGVTDRELRWDGCVNVRDLGGLPLHGGGTTRSGQIVRADSVQRLTPAGWRSLREYGVRRIIDLRYPSEREKDKWTIDGFDLVAISLLGAENPAEAARHDELTRGATDDATATARFYLDALENRSAQIADSVEAVAAAPDGGVVVHCFVGKDRTGIVAALLLGLAGVPVDSVVEDYALSGSRIGPLVERWIAAADDEHEQAFRRRVSAAPADGLRRVLGELEARWGGAEAYLLQAGLAAADVARVRTRLRGN